VFDNTAPGEGGTDVSCRGQTVFCNGLDGISDVVPFDNTNCDTARLEGTAGQGRCPASYPPSLLASNNEKRVGGALVERRWRQVSRLV